MFTDTAGVAAGVITPYVQDKMIGPPVVATDEAGHFCTPLLLGYVGGADELTERMTGWSNGIPVMTMATDINGVFTVDVFAARNGLCTTDGKEAKEISAWLLGGREMSSFCDSKCHGVEGVRDICKHNTCINRVYGHSIWITLRNSERPSSLRLVLRVVVVGMGYRKGTPPDILERRVPEALENSGIDPAAVKVLSTINTKVGGAAVPQLAGRYG